jgi:hypothetical protein
MTASMTPDDSQYDSQYASQYDSQYASQYDSQYASQYASQHVTNLTPGNDNPTSRQTMAAAAAETCGRRAGKTWCAFARHLLEAGSLFARLTPPDDDPTWRHAALTVAPTETARRRRYQLRRSYTNIGGAVQVEPS